MSGMGLQNVSGTNQIFNLAVQNANGSGFWTNGAGSTTTFNSGLNLTTSGSSASRTLTLGGAGTWDVASAIANGGTATNGGMTITGTGLAIFGGNNTYGGSTIISSGATLRITSNTGLGSTNTGTTVNTGGQLQLSGGITVNAGEALSLSGSNGATASLRNISGDNTYNGGIGFNSGTNRIDSDAGTLTLSSFTNTLNSTKSLLVGGAGDTTFTGGFTGSATALLTKDGAGTLTLAATNFDIGGGVLVKNGKLNLATNNALGANRAVVINGGTLDITTFNNAVGAVSLTNGAIAGSTGVLTGTSYAVESGTISAILGGTGALTKANAGTVTLSSANTYTGLTTVNGGTLALSGSGSLGATNGAVSIGAGTIDLGGLIRTNGAFTLDTGTLRNGTLTASSYALTNAGTVSAALAGAGGLTKSGSGTATLSGNNSYTGNTTISGGTLATDGNEVLSDNNTVNVGTGATFRLGGNERVASVAGLGTADLQSYTLTYGGTGSTAHSAQAIGTGGLVKNGSGFLTLGASNSTYSGGFTLNSGTARYTQNGVVSNGVVTSGVFGTGTLTVNGGTLMGGGAGGLNVTRMLVNSNFSVNVGTYSNTGDNGRTSFAGVMDLAGDTRTISLGRWTNAAGVLASGTESFRFNSNNLLPATITNGTVRFVRDGLGSSSDYAAVNFNAGMVIARGVGITIGTNVITTMTTSDPWGTNTTPNFRVEQGGIFNLSTDTGARNVTVRTLEGEGLVTSLGFTNALSTLTIGTQAGDSATFSGRIVDGSSLNATLGTVANNLGMALTKTGSGTQILSGSNSYSGLTTVRD
jgi:autotransporter-associated beta strand protein